MAGEGWGMSVVFQDLLSREPHTIPVNDIKTLQRNLKTQGYLPPTTQVSGAWDPASSAAFSRFERDNEELVRSGKHWLSAPLNTGLRTLSYTLPSSVMQGIVGAAKGIVTQAPETAERLGVAGGAAAGALIGSVIPGVGTAAGAIGGAVLGGIADLFGGDEGEEDQSLAEKFVDILTPWEEYKAQGPKALFEDLGFVLTAASLVSGGALAVRGVAGGVAAMRGGGLAGALAKPALAEPGWAAKVMGAGLNKVGASSAADTWIGWSARNGLLAQTSRPLIKTINAGFTGLASANVGARLTAGLGSGGTTSTIEREIKKGPVLPSWVDNTVGWVMYSNKFLPIQEGQIGRAFQKALGDTNLFPYLHVGQATDEAGRVQSLGKTRGTVQTVLGDTDTERVLTDLRLRLDYGIKRQAGEELNKLGRIDDQVKFEKFSMDKRAEITRKLRDDLENGDGTYARDLLSWSYGREDVLNSGPMAYTGFLQGLDGVGSPLERIVTLRNANKRILDLTNDIDNGNLSVTIREGLDAEADLSKPFSDFPTNFERKELRKQADDLNKAAKSLERQADTANSWQKTEQLRTQASELKAQAKEIAAKVKKVKPVKVTRDRPYHISVARKYDPANHAAGYATEQDILGLADEYDRLAQTVKATAKSKSPDNPIGNKAWRDARDQMETFANDLRFRGLISDDLVRSAARDKPSEYVSTQLRQKAQYHAREVVVPEAIAGEFDAMGYKLIATRDKLEIFDDMDKVRQKLEVTGVGDYTKRAALVETLGMSPYRHSDRSLFALRIGHEASELEQAFAENGIALTGRQGLKKLHDYLVKYNHSKGAKEVSVPEFGNIVLKVKETPHGIQKARKFYKVDTRELTPDDITEALELESVIPKIKEKVLPYDEWVKSQKVYGGDDEVGASIDEIAEVLPAKGPSGYHLEDAEGGRVMVYRNEAGLVKAGLTIDDVADGVRISHVVVDPAYRRKGIATKLYDEAEKAVPGVKATSGRDGFTEEGAKLAYSRYKAEAATTGDLLHDPDDVALKIYQSLKDGAAFGGEAHLLNPRDSVRMLGRAMRVNGLPGFTDFMRTSNISPRIGGAVGGGLLGAGVGMAEGEDLGDVFIDAGLGAAGGLGLGALLKHRYPKGTYGYLPDKLHRLNMTLRYSLSPFFDAGRYMEQNTLGMAKANLPVIVKPRAYITRKYGQGAWDEAVDTFERINGTKVMRVVEDIDRRMFQKGVLGFSPRDHEAAQMFILKRRGWSDRKIEETVSVIGRYGTGRTAAEKTANFIFFPFSFQKKMVSILGDAVVQAPARALLIHEGLRRFEQSSADEGFSDFIDKHLPIARQLARLNNLSYGLSPGKFFLDGVADQKTELGTITQILSSAFVPSGAAASLSQAFGGVASAAVHLFAPVVLSDQNSLEEAVDSIDAYVPAWRDIGNFVGSVGEQFTAVTEGAAPYYQFQEYNDEKRALKAEWEPIAQALGYASADGFLASTAGQAIKADLDAKEIGLIEKYPTGARMASEFTQNTDLNAAMLAQISEDPNRSKAQQTILNIAEMEDTAKGMARILGMSQEDVTAMFASQIRREALKHVDDREFMEAWGRFFESTYGPIERIAA